MKSQIANSQAENARIMYGLRPKVLLRHTSLQKLGRYGQLMIDPGVAMKHSEITNPT